MEKVWTSHVQMWALGNRMSKSGFYWSRLSLAFYFAPLLCFRYNRTSRENMIKKGDLYFPTEEFQKKALLNNASIYKEAAKDLIKFWEKL